MYHIKSEIPRNKNETRDRSWPVMHLNWPQPKFHLCWEHRQTAAHLVARGQILKKRMHKKKGLPQIESKPPTRPQLRTLNDMHIQRARHRYYSIDGKYPHRWTKHHGASQTERFEERCAQSRKIGPNTTNAENRRTHFWLVWTERSRQKLMRYYL